MSEKWPDEELEASVIAYLDMYKKELNHQRFIKKRYYQQLSERFGRTEKAYEYRMQNISYVFSTLGRNWVTGLKPAKNVGPSNAPTIEKFIFKHDGNYQAPSASLALKVSEFSKKYSDKIPSGTLEPPKQLASVTQYVRDPAVKAWVLNAANGHCECCGKPAPFMTALNEPFLEVHHLRQLADGGSDTVANAVALCPNCHRELHYGMNKRGLVEEIYISIPRLKRE
ncbi:MAG: HNH endonuclease signature motif containing protein [Cellvibrio sp.]